MTRRLNNLPRHLITFLAVLIVLLSSGQAASALFVGTSTIFINGVFADWGSPVSGVYRHQDLTNTGINDGSGFSGTSADLNYFWNAMSTQSGGSPASTLNPIKFIYYRIDTFTTGVIRPGQLYNIQLNLGTAPAGKADHLLQIWVDDRANPQVSLVLYSYSTPYPAIGAYTSGTITSKVSNIASPFPGFSGAVDTTATGAYGKYDATHYGVEVGIPVAWYGSTYAGLVKNDGSGSPAYYGTIFTSTGTLGAVGTVKDTMNKSDGTPVYFVVDTSTGETNTEDLKTINITATKTDAVFLGSTPPVPGDTLLYTVVVTNSGSSTANNVVFQDTITDTNLTWCDNVTVVPARTFVSSSNGVQVTIGNMAPGSSENITFRAQIKSTIPAGINKVTNQGTVSGSNFSSVPTDDPDTSLASDATATPVAASPIYAVEPYKTWALTNDADGNGYPSPGDTITYTVTLENTGNQPAGNVTFTDIPDSNSSLLAGSVTTTSGSVTKGNSAFDNSVLVTIAAIPISATVTVTFKVIVANPLPAGVTQLSNQGFVSGDHFPVDPTDDPTDQSYDNPTVTPLTAAPLIEAYKRYELTGDANHNGLPNIGDNLTYFITIANKGNQDATSVSFTDTPGIGTTMVANSVITSQGSVTSGNNPGNTTVAVNVGTIPGGNSTVEISFKVTIVSAPSGGIDNQGTVIADGPISTVTDDPNTHTLNDPTHTAIASDPPHLSVTKSAILAIDADSNGVPSAGDTLQYIVAINNNGGSAATGIVFKDPIETTYVSLVADNVSTTKGTVVHGNDPADTTVEVNIGDLEAGTTHSICLVTFRVLIKSTLPADVNTLSNVGNVEGTNFLDVPTVDPNTGLPTVTTIYASPLITATKTDFLFDDADENTYPSQGDTLEYTVTITNSGTTAARNVVFQDSITDPNLTWCDNVTVVPARTFVSSSNGVQVIIGTLDAGNSVSIKFRAIIENTPTKVINQGIVSGSNFSSVPTDDPNTSLANDPTSTAVSPTDMVEPYKTWALTNDADHNGYPSPGDNLTYTIRLENVGNRAAENVTFTDVPDPNSTLAAGSVTTTRGDVTGGMDNGDKSVTVHVGDIPKGTTENVTFIVTVNSPLPFGVTEISNQGFVHGNNFPVDPTDDPTDQSYDNPTVTPLTAVPLIEAYKRYELTDDNDHNGSPSAGDNLTYFITIANKGNQDASGVSFSDYFSSENITLVTGSINTSQGTVTSQTSTGLSVNLGAIAGNNTIAEISFKVTINPGAEGGIYNQGTVTVSGLPDVLTDDPNTHTANDPTYTAITNSPPHLSVTKSAVLAIDADNNSVPSPGDTLQYIVAINNNGGSAATGVTFTDTLDANTAIVPDSTQTSQGSVTAETPAITVNIGTLEAGTSHSICLVTFQVTIDNPFPVNTDTVSNQGMVAASWTGGPISVLTDDPATDALRDATATAVYADPLISATKAASVFADVLPDGASPGDTLLYTVTITNSGTTDARSVVFHDAITDPYLILASNSLTTTKGTKVKGDNPADQAVQVDIGDMSAGLTVTITFKVIIETPTPPTVINRVTNQGLVSGSNFSSVPTDDPYTVLADDPTNTTVSPTDRVEPFKTWKMITDADHNGYPSPGDTLTYTVTLQNVGNGSALGVIFTDIPDPNSTLVAGSVTTDPVRTVDKGNTAGDKSVTVDAGTIGQGTSVTIEFEVTVNDPLPFGVTQLSNQGFVSGSNFAVDPTDDPTDQSYDNPTITPLTAAPLIEAYKSYDLTDDNDNNGLPSVGDNLTYFITITNKGNQDATSVGFTDTPGSGTVLVAGSVITSQGSVETGNTPGNTAVAVDVGTIPGGNDTATISFKATIISAPAAGIYNQGRVTAPYLDDVLTDDPNTHTANDPTYTAIAQGPPELRVTKSAVLAVDADNNGIPSPGDTLQYIVAINNNGGSEATSVVFADTPDTIHTSLVAGTVSKTQGTVVLGNTSGDTAVQVNIGTLEAGTSHSICLVTFQVTINNPLPADLSTVSNQGAVQADGGISVLTDDPNTDTSPDATETTAYAPLINATKTVGIAIDADNNGTPSPGDNLTYTIVISNTGSAAARSVHFQDAVARQGLTLTDVITTLGTILRGNTPGDTEVQVDVGDIPAGASVTITIGTAVGNPLPLGVNHFSNQGYITGSNFSLTPTDDPDTSLINDATTTPVTSMPMVEPYKTWALTSDADNNGYPSPGDTITYTLIIENTGNQDAAGVTFTDVPAPHSTLVAGSVTTTRGTVTTGNGAGDSSVSVNVGTVQGGNDSVTITFQVKVDSPLPSGVTTLSNQGFVSGSNFPSDPTDNPGDEAYDNPTVTSLSAAPLIMASKSFQLSGDANHNGLPDPGDNLTYIINIINNGNEDASAVIFNDTPDPNTTLIAGTVITSQGAVTTGNADGDTDVAVNLGTLPGNGGSATISFTVTIKGTQGLTLISNQGRVTGSNFTSAPTDDPGTTKLNDATETHTAADTAPSLHVTKAAILSSDADHTGLPSPGDIMQYVVTINNTGNSPALNVVFADTPDHNTSLVVGSVSTTQGTVVSGNTTGNTSILVNIGTLPGGTAHSVCLVTFKVRINSPFPAGAGSISNQGRVTASGGIYKLTEDPGITSAPGVATKTTVYPGPTVARAETQPNLVSELLDDSDDSHSSGTVVAGDRPWQPSLSKSQTTAVIGKPVDLPAFKSSNLVIKATEEGHIIYIDVTNTGKATGSYTLNLKINGYTAQSKAVSLDPSASKVVQWLVSDDQPGTYTVEVDGMSGSYTVDMLQQIKKLISPDAVLLISTLLVLASLLLAIVYVWRRRQQQF